MTAFPYQEISRCWIETFKRVSPNWLQMYFIENDEQPAEDIARDLVTEYEIMHYALFSHHPLFLLAVAQAQAIAHAKILYEENDLRLPFPRFNPNSSSHVALHGQRDNHGTLNGFDYKETSQEFIEHFTTESEEHIGFGLDWIVNDIAEVIYEDKGYPPEPQQISIRDLVEYYNHRIAPDGIEAEGDRWLDYFTAFHPDLIDLISSDLCALARAAMGAQS